MGSENNRTFGGQNMFNVYSVRSYKAEVEMMGNAMIQPMMYFQLNNIPMFHGAYMITHVKHNIKPNFMSTHFTGVRIRFPETPLMTSIDMYKSLLGSIDVSLSSNALSNTVTTDLSSNVFPDISLFKLEEKIDEKANPPIVTVVGGFVNPFGGNYPITSATGFRSMDGEIKNHKGLDFGTPYDTKKGTLLQSIFTGTIEKIKMNANGFGLYMVINHGMLGDEKKFYKTVYGHLSNINIDILNKMKSDGIISNTDLTKLPSNEVASIVNGVNPNIKVTRGQVVAESGGIRGINFLDSAKTYDFAGHSTGAHLHFELRLSDSDIDFTSMKYVNAVPYLPLGQNAENAKYLPPSDTQDVSASITFIQTPKNEVRLTTLREYKNWD
jgi:murein DD-endopeptidase MepM/ murein hydrolase activator NlpD